MSTYKEYTGVHVPSFEKSPARLQRLSYAQLKELADIAEDAYYLLDLNKVSDNYHQFRSCFAQQYEACQVAYSFKTNYTPALCHHLKELGCFAEVVSRMEYDIATKVVGYHPSQVIVNGPVHSQQFVETVMTDGALFNADAWYLLAMVEKVCQRYPERHFKIGVRITYPITEGGDSRFGIPSDKANMSKLINWQNSLKNCEIVGFHSHYSNSSRSTVSFASRINGLLSASEAFFSSTTPNFINVGGGFFGHMPDSLAVQYGESVATFEQYAEAICTPIRSQYTVQEGVNQPLLLLEPGTALVSNAMVFVAQVLEVKSCSGRKVALINGSNHNVNHKWQGETLPVQLITKPGSRSTSNSGETFDIVGNTCIEKDIICQTVNGTVQAGDFVVFQYMGGYSNVLKQPFIHPCQGIYAWHNQRLLRIKRSGDMHSVLSDYQ
ncbi:MULTISPECIES: hypothetical protein [Pseudoalteromonas]|uniref:Orn/DAP/Arg decarboxylase 2 N-terminal domain-containing protein n=1 Tax=Pseudoalteromonas amylolytica TaxID=1859457 RepID=A0A1S1MY11_9GAMM|nr:MULTISPECIES: hypothetical protein [Pseudoalteromonas]OHU89142.1 hypothetical protein BFC16_05710 [Pseudoalteromonas sp. JW3]OHU92042.1 hypothetical protein BET10_06815 [Pseudoalteromonas amylolytica]